MTRLPTLALGLVLVTAGPSVALGAETAQIATADCRWLVRHVPAADVAYQPGVDVEGNSVVPADLAGTPELRLPEVIPVLITVDLQDRFQIPANSVLFEGHAGIGLVEVEGDRVAFNGQPLTDPEVRALAAVCERAGIRP